MRKLGGKERPAVLILYPMILSMMAMSMTLPVMEAGDLVAIPSSGAYVPAMASNYNLNPRPAIVMVKDGSARIIRRRESYQDMMAMDLV